MIIAIDGYEANIPNRVGIGRYAYEILRGIHASLSDRWSRGECSVKVRVYLPQSPIADMPEETEFWEYRTRSPKKFWTFVGLPIALVLDTPHANVVFSPTHYAPRFVSIPKVISIMDLSYLSFPVLFRPKDLHQLIHWTAYSARRASHIFTISEFSRDAIMSTYGRNRNDVTVTYPGTSDFQKTPMTKTDVCKKYGISQNYLLSVGTLQPRKNFVRLIEAFSLFLAENKQKFRGLELVIIGKKGWLYDDILSSPKKFGVERQVKFLDFVPDSDLPLLYRYALAFALPSLYEGFGLPVIEAMKEGCPVVVSNVSSLPEIAGKAAILVNPNDSKDIARGLLLSVRQRNLLQGKTRIAYGIERAKEFSWDKAAKQTLEILEKVGKLNT